MRIIFLFLTRIASQRVVNKFGDGYHRYWTGLVLYRHTQTGKIISASFVDGTTSAYVNPKKLNRGQGPWAVTKLGPEPINIKANKSCVSFAGTKSYQITKEGLVAQHCNAGITMGYICQKPCSAEDQQIMNHIDLNKPFQINYQAGTVWPLPQKINYGSENRTVKNGSVVMMFRGQQPSDCDILEHAKNTYENKWLFGGPLTNITEPGSPINFVINLREKCPTKEQFPGSEMKEEYRLTVPLTGDVLLEADEIWGVLRGIETFSQLFFQQNGQHLLRTGTIHDWPEYPIRGIMLDTSRHYLKKNVILRQIDLLAMNKMNTLHWHIVDLESFPYVSQRFPNISLMGSFTPQHIYSPDDVKEILQHARVRGVRVMPEFDTPGHMASWRGAGIMATCRDEKGQPVPSSMLDPSQESTFEFLREFFREVLAVFPDKYLHLGCDEAALWTKQCWANNPGIQQFMRQKKLNNIIDLENYYINRLQNLTKALFAEQQETGRKMVFWQEVFDKNKPDPSETIVHIWYSKDTPARYSDTKRAVEKGFQVLISSCWYLNYISYGADWRDGGIYHCDPRGFDGTSEQKQLVIGGIATAWAEFIDGTNVEARMWPRTSAVAERLWSAPNQTRDADAAWPRLQEHRCRMVARGYRAQPVNGTSFCVAELDEHMED